MFTVKFVLKSLLTGDAIWRQNSWPTLIQVMTCRLTPTNHYLHHVDYLSVTSCDIQLRAVWYGMRKGFALEMVYVIYVPLILHILYWNCSVGRISFILRCNTVISACFHLQVTSSLYVLCNVPLAHNADDLKWLRYILFRHHATILTNTKKDPQCHTRWIKIQCIECHWTILLCYQYYITQLWNDIQNTNHTHMPLILLCRDAQSSESISVECIIFFPMLHRSDWKVMIKIASSKTLFPSPKTHSKHSQFTPILLSFYVHIFNFCDHTTVSINRKTAKPFSTQFVFWILRNIYSTLFLQLEVTQPKQLYYETVRWTKLLDLKQWSNI